MPTINFSLKDLQNLFGKKLSIEQVKKLAEYGKGELQEYNKDEVKIDFGDTNLPYLWSVEGVARLFKGLIGKQKGIPKINVGKGNYKLIVEQTVNEARPYISAFVARGQKINDYLIKQIIGLQEKLCESYGRRREKIAIGIYPLKKIKFPIYYKATSPESIKFVPLDFKKKMTQQEILKEHPTGKEYGWILKNYKKYPILTDSNNNVLSFPPIINSEDTGRINIDDNELFFEATGTELNGVLLATNIFAQALYERGFKIYSVDVKYKNKIIRTPYLFNDEIKIKRENVNKILGTELNEEEIKKLLEKMRYEYSNGKVKIPSYRRDILHEADIIEDIAISYGYDNIKELQLKTFTTGNMFKINNLIDKIREIFVGLGFQETLSAILTSRELLYKKMDVSDIGTVEIENFMSENYSCLRTWILPILMEILSKNKHVEYPQKIFEEGLISTRNGNNVVDHRKLAVAMTDSNADYTAIKQVLDNLMRSICLSYSIENIEHGSFIPGRVGKIIVNKKEIGFLGEIHPIVLENFSLENPVAAMELDLERLFELI